VGAALQLLHRRAGRRRQPHRWIRGAGSFFLVKNKNKKIKASTETKMWVLSLLLLKAAVDARGQLVSLSVQSAWKVLCWGVRRAFLRAEQSKEEAKQKELLLLLSKQQVEQEERNARILEQLRRSDRQQQLFYSYVLAREQDLLLLQDSKHNRDNKHHRLLLPPPLPPLPKQAIQHGDIEEDGKRNESEKEMDMMENSVEIWEIVDDDNEKIVMQ
jgi:hypothetical protein